MSDLTEHDLALALLTDALFCSDLPLGSAPTGKELASAIRRSLKTHRGWNGCTRMVAAAFASAPTGACLREAWCRQLVEDALDTADFVPALTEPE